MGVCREAFANALSIQIYLSSKRKTASLVAAWVGNALLFLLAKGKAPKSKWIAGRQLRSYLGWEVTVSGKEWSFRNCNSFAIFTCNQAAHLQRKLIMLFYPVTLGCSLIMPRFQALIFLASFSCFFPLSAGIFAFLNSQILIINVDQWKIPQPRYKYCCGWIWAGMQRFISGVRCPLDQAAPCLWCPILVQRILKSNVFCRCLHLIISFWKDKNFSCAHFSENLAWVHLIVRAFTKFHHIITEVQILSKNNLL